MYKTKTNTQFRKAGRVISWAFLALLVAVFFTSQTVFARDRHDEENEHTHDVAKGSIRICKILVDKDENVYSGTYAPGEFSISGLTAPAFSYIQSEAGILPETTWTAPLSNLNEDLIGNDGINDASCKTYSNITIGSYYYDREVVNGSDWQETRYNDQYSIDVSSLTDFYSYDDRIFTGDEMGDRDMNADGNIILTTARPNRTLVLFSKTTKDVPAPEKCILEISNSPDRTEVIPGDSIVYNITVTNAGTADCTGGGVKIQDLLDTKLEYVSETHSANFSSGYYGPVLDGSILKWNGHEMNPGVSGNITVTAKVKQSEACGDYSVSNTARASSNEYNWEWVNGAPVVVAVKNSCPGSNNAPLIDIVGTNPFSFTVGGTFDSLAHATTSDSDGDVVTLHASSSVDANTVGTYYVDYTAKDEHGLAAAPKKLEVKVESAAHHPECSDALDNDVDGKTDISDPACHTDGNPDNQQTYDPNINTENSAPIITLVGSVPFTFTVGGTFDPMAHATTSDSDGDTVTLHASSSVNSAVAGTYLVDYTAEDEHGLSATPKKLVVEVVVAGHHPECSDTIDNDGDNNIDTVDSACHTDGNSDNPVTYDPNIDNENSAPVITLIGNNPLYLYVDDVYTEPGATAFDKEDGVISPVIITGAVNKYDAGTYVIKYNISDSKGLPAPEQSRSVIVQSRGGGCTSNCGGGGGGGGGGGSVIITSPTLVITNEAIEKGSLSGISVIRWTTNLPSDSRVVYGTSSVTSFPSGDQKYGYPKTTVTVAPLVTTHSVAVAGLNPNATHYFRPVSRTSSLSAVGKELVSAPAECYYLREFMKYGSPDNNPVEVKKLQAFLNEFESADLIVSGYFDLETLDAVNLFQNKYKVNILDPWGHKAPTGYVYLTTRKEVNEIYCRAAFPLDGAQTDEVNAFRAFLLGLQNQGIVEPTAEETPGNQFVPDEGLVNGTTDKVLSLLEGQNNPEGQVAGTGTSLVSAQSPVTNRGNFRNMIAGAYGAVSDIVVNYWLALILLALLTPVGFYAKKMLNEEAEEEIEVKK